MNLTAQAPIPSAARASQLMKLPCMNSMLVPFLAHAMSEFPQLIDPAGLIAIPNLNI